MTELRLAERAGRTRAEKRLRDLQGGKQGAALPDAKGAATAVIPYPLRPIGTLHSVFSQRNGTPRQPLLVPLARARLKLRAGIPRDCLQGLEGYSHCWVLYVFHENTDLARLWRADTDADRGLKGKVGVPRLNGGRMGVLATRSPHRPCPIGLSVAEIVAVDGDTITLAGADVVNGTPVLDVKPYLPFADGVPGATAPPWVASEAPDEPLQMAAVDIPPAAAAAISVCWQRAVAKGASLYASADALLALVRQALARDIRSVHQRLHVDHRVCAASAPSPVPVPKRLEYQSGGDATAEPNQPAPNSAQQPAAGARGTSATCMAAQESAMTDADEEGQDQNLTGVNLTPAGGDEVTREPGDAQSRTADDAGKQGVYHVVLDGVDISYDVADNGAAHVRTATPWQNPTAILC